MSQDYFDNWFWTSKKTDNVCPGMGTAKCTPPNACARDPNTGKEYCCDKQSKGGSVCWSLAEKCSSSGGTINCGTGNQLYCCLDKRERCSETPNQTGICWNTADDTLNNITYSDLDSAFSSVSSSKTAATSWAFDPVTLPGFTAPPGASTTTTSGTGATTSSPTQTSQTSSPSQTGAPPSGSSASLSGGAIAGIAIGSVAGVVILGLLAWFMRRRRSGASRGGPDNHIAAYSEMDGKSPHGGGHSPATTAASAYQPVPGYSPGAVPAAAAAVGPGGGGEYYSKNGGSPQQPVEMPAPDSRLGAQELPGDTSTYAGSVAGAHSVSSTPQAAYAQPR